VKGCHSCDHAAAIAEGKFAGKAWEDVPCSKCDVLGGGDLVMEFEHWRRADEAVGSDEENGAEDRLPITVMREAMVGFLSLRPELRDVVAWRYAGMKYEDIAEVQGVTMACVEKRHRRAMELWPVLWSLFPEKSAKQERRRRGGASGD